MLSSGLVFVDFFVADFIHTLEQHEPEVVNEHPELKAYYFGNLTADRVLFSTGRDLELDPKPADGPLNFFVYPHIEVGDKTLPKENVELQFSFKNS